MGKRRKAKQQQKTMPTCNVAGSSCDDPKSSSTAQPDMPSEAPVPETSDRSTKKQPQVQDTCQSTDKSDDPANFQPDTGDSPAVPVASERKKGKQPQRPQRDAPLSGRADETANPAFRSFTLPSDEPDLYTIRSIGPDDYGVFAARTIRRGERIMDEPPLLMDRTYSASASLQTVSTYDRLSDEEAEAFESLQLNDYLFDRYIAGVKNLPRIAQMTPANSQGVIQGEVVVDQHVTYTGAEIKEFNAGIAHCAEQLLRGQVSCPIEEDNMVKAMSEEIQRRVLILATFDSNQIMIERSVHNGKAVFLQASRLNHHCSPNAILCWNDQTERGTVHALRKIRRGEQIYISYLPKQTVTYNERQEYLQGRYGFECKCTTCCSETSQENRRALGDLYVRWHVNYPIPLTDETKAKVLQEEPRRALMDNLTDVIRATVKEGMIDLDFATLLNQQAFFKSLNRDRRSMLSIWRLKQQAYVIYVRCYGLDHPYVAKRQRELRDIWPCMDENNPVALQQTIARYGNHYEVRKPKGAPPCVPCQEHAAHEPTRRINDADISLWLQGFKQMLEFKVRNCSACNLEKEERERMAREGRSYCV